MKRNIRTTLLGPALVATLATLALGCGPDPAGTTYGGSIDVRREPDQVTVTDAPVISFERHGYRWTLTPKAEYTVDAIVLSAKGYGSDWNAMVSPCDLALAWGKMVSTGLHKQLKWSQSGRWYYWRYGGDFPFDNAFVSKYSANTHVIPATDNLALAVRRIDRGDSVELVGYLVYLTATDGKDDRWWNSSLSRDDTGDGSCEVLYLTAMRCRGMEYR